MGSEIVEVRRSAGVAYVYLARPEVRNAFNAELIAVLIATCDELAHDDGVRAVVLGGKGNVFSAGADVQWMRASLELSEAENLEDARRMSQMFRALDRLPKVVVGRIHGAALGGGVGLTAVCDVAIAAEDTTFGMTETKLGIMPAVISPFVLAKIGASHMRALALTGERFGAQRALAIGLVHEVVTESGLDAAVARVVAEARSAGATGVAATKALLRGIAGRAYDDTLEPTTAAIAKQRTGSEGQEGLRAFLERRSAAWAQ
jgi:methylglutaconyl-CoA hydratase